MPTLETSIREIQAVARSLPGVIQAQDLPTDSAIQFPFAVTYPREGTIERVSDFSRSLHTVYAEIHCGRTLLPDSIRLALPLVELFPAGIWADPTLNGSVSTVTSIRYTFGNMEWGGTKTIGYRFEITFKQEAPA